VPVVEELVNSISLKVKEAFAEEIDKVVLDELPKDIKEVPASNVKLFELRENALEDPIIVKMELPNIKLLALVVVE
jgi:hypothetical protein